MTTASKRGTPASHVRQNEAHPQNDTCNRTKHKQERIVASSVDPGSAASALESQALEWGILSCHCFGEVPRFAKSYDLACLHRAGFP